MKLGIFLFVVLLIMGIIIIARGRHVKAGVVLLIILLIIGSVVVIKTRQNRILEKVVSPVVQEKVESSVEGTASVSSGFTLGAGESVQTLRVNGANHRYLVFVPTSYDKKKKTPLLLFFHGGGGSMDQAARDYGMKEKAEQEGFIVAFPNGESRLPGGKFATWNAGNCCGYARDTKSDDVGLTRAVIQDIENKFFIDTDKIFATGMSNGGMMVHRLACEMADTFKAVASVAGPDGTLSCTPSRPIPVLHIHAKNDDHVLFNGGAGPASSKDTGQVADFVSVAETIARWVVRDKMSPQPTRVLDTAGAYCDLYTSSVNTAQVKLCVTETGGHSWPGGPTVRGKAPSQAISANDVMWDFFKSQTK